LTSDPSLIEYAGEIKDYYPKKKVTIVQGDSQLLNSTYTDKFRKRIEKDIRARGVELILNDFVDDPNAKGPITTRNGQKIEADLIVS